MGVSVGFTLKGKIHTNDFLRREDWGSPGGAPSPASECRFYPEREKPHECSGRLRFEATAEEQCGLRRPHIAYFAKAKSLSLEGAHEPT